MVRDKPRTNRSNQNGSQVDSLLKDFLPGGATNFLIWTAAKPDAISHLAEGAVKNWLDGKEGFPLEALPAVAAGLEGALRAIEEKMGTTDEPDPS